VAVNPDGTVVDKILAIEWEMFQSVNENGPRAECQENPSMFDAMRRGQYSTWSNGALMNYLCDLRIAKADGRNLITERYIHMMKYTEPSAYEKLAGSLTCPSDRVCELADEICGRLLKQSASLAEKFPAVAALGRPLLSEGDGLDVTSVETYQKGELLTYSENTLIELRNHIDALEREGISLVRQILENHARYYGYGSLEDAEGSIRLRAQIQNG
jgi:hypothetical protein